MLRYRDFLILNEQADVEDTEGSTSGLMTDYKNDTQARTNINSAIQANANYNSLFTAIKNYWTKQIPLLKNKPKDQMTDSDESMLDMIEAKFKTNDPKEIENYAMQKVIGGHKKELEYNKDKKALTIKGYTETTYDKTIKSK
jgi:hypothetical protein